MSTSQQSKESEGSKAYIREVVTCRSTVHLPSYVVIVAMREDKIEGIGQGCTDGWIVERHVGLQIVVAKTPQQPCKDKRPSCLI